jgi:hypothetical protein
MFRAFDYKFYSQIGQNTNKKAACCFYPTGCAFGKSVKLFTAGYRTPVGFHPTGHRQVQVFRRSGYPILRLICLIMGTY